MKLSKAEKELLKLAGRYDVSDLARGNEIIGEILKRTPEEFKDPSRKKPLRLDVGLLEIETQLSQFVNKFTSAFNNSFVPNSIPVRVIGTGSMNAITLHAKSDNSFAIGIDVALINKFWEVFAYVLWLDDLHVAKKDRKWLTLELSEAVLSAFDTKLGRFKKRKGSEFETILSRGISRTCFGISGLMILAMERFVIAHEVAHIILGHFSKEKSIPSDDGSLLLYNHKLEYEADKWASESLDAISLEDEMLQDNEVTKVFQKHVPTLMFRLWHSINRG